MNASKLKYRNRLKRRIIISRQQLDQPSPLQPTADAVVVPKQESSPVVREQLGDCSRDDTDGNNGGHVVIKEAPIVNSNSKAPKEGGRRSGSGNGNGDNNNHVAKRNSRSAGKPNSDNNSNNQMVGSSNNEGEAMIIQRAKDIMTKRSHERSNSSNNSPVATPPRAAAAAGNDDYHDNFDTTSETTPTRKNSNRQQHVVFANNTHDDSRGSAAVRIMDQERQNYPTNFTTRTAAQQQQQQYRYLSPPEGHDDIMSTTTSVLTDEAMEDRNFMIKNVVQWERRMQLKRQQQQQEKKVRQKKQQQKQQKQLTSFRQSHPRQEQQIWDDMHDEHLPSQSQRHQIMQQQQRQNDWTKHSKQSSEEEEEHGVSIVNLVHEAINQEMMKKSPMRSSPSHSANAASAVNSVNIMSATPKHHHSALAAMVSPDDKQLMMDDISISSSSTNEVVVGQPPPPPSSSDDKELPPSPAPTDHSADAAAGMMFALLREKSSNSTNTTTRKKGVVGLVNNTEEVEVVVQKNEDMMMTQVTNQQQHIVTPSPLRANHHGASSTQSKVVGPSLPSTPPRIITPSSGGGGGKPPTPPSSTPRRRRHHHQLNLEQKLGRLTNNNNNNNTSSSSVYSTSSKVSIQPSIESECVRQNAEILLAMEDAMMNFMGVGVGGATTVQSIDDSDDVDEDDDADIFEEVDVNNEERLNEALGGLIEESSKRVAARESEEVEEEEDNVGIGSALSPSELEALDVNHGFHIPLNNDSGDGGGTHNQLSDTFSTLFSLDERDESDDYVDPPLIHDDSNSRSDAFSSFKSGSMNDEQQGGASEEFVIAEQRSVVRRKDKTLGTFLDQLGSLLGVGCNLDRDEDSDVFYMNNSQFNTSLSVDVEDWNQRQRRMEGEVAVKAEKKDTRNGSAPAILGSESFGGESHTTMPRGNTAKLRAMYDQLAYLSPPARDSGLAVQFARHDISSDGPPDPELSLDMDDDDDDVDDGNDDEVDDNVDEGDERVSPPDPEASVVGSGGGKDPPRGIDPEEGEAVLCRNRVQKLNLRSLDHVKMSSREKHKGSSLHWQSSNGLILDDEKNAKQLSSFRAKAREAEKVASISNLPSISASATILQEHFVESEHKLSPNYRRRGGGQLQFINEVEEEDGSDSSVEEEGEVSTYNYEQFVEEFRGVVQNDAATSEPEPVEELIIGSISESSSLDEELVDFDSSLRPCAGTHDQAKPQNVTQRREYEAAVQRSIRQASYSPQQQHAHHDPKLELTKPRIEEKQQQWHSSQSAHQPGNKHPHHIPQPEPVKTRLEEKLQGLGAPKNLNCGDSVGTSELGSLYSASVAGVPKTIFHRTHPPLACSTPSSMQNTVDYSTNRAVASPNQRTRQRALNTISRDLTPVFSSQVPLQGRVSSQHGHTTANGYGGRVPDSNNTLGFTPIGSETSKLKNEFLDSLPLDPPPRSSPLGFFPSSIDEVSHLSDGFGRLINNTLGSLQVGAETWNLKYDFHYSPAKQNDPFHPPQSQKLERRHHSEPVAPPNVNRHREQIPSRPPKPVSNHPPKKLVMKSVSEIRDGTRVQTLRFVGREDSPSPQQPLSPPTRLPTGKKRFQSFPSAVKMVRLSSSPQSQRVSRSSSSPQSQRVSHVVQRSNQPLQRQIMETERLHNQQGTHIGLRQTANNPAPTRPVMKRSLEDKLRGMDPPSSSEKPTFAEASQVSGSVFEAVEVGSFGVQHTLFSKWDKPKDVNSHPVPQNQAPGMYHGRSVNQTSSVSYVSTFHGRQTQDPVVANLNALRSNRGRFKDRVKAIATKASQKLVMPGAGGSPQATRVYI
jgi:hypothetical protein